MRERALVGKFVEWLAERDHQLRDHVDHVD
jgi:hypothetical protein